jgi:hypothetical protein
LCGRLIATEVVLLFELGVNEVFNGICVADFNALPLIRGSKKIQSYCVKKVSLSKLLKIESFDKVKYKYLNIK